MVIKPSKVPIIGNNMFHYRLVHRHYKGKFFFRKAHFLEIIFPFIDGWVYRCDLKTSETVIRF